MNLNNELLEKGPVILEAEFTTEIRVHKYITTTALIISLVVCIMYGREVELSKAKSSQLQQRDAKIAESGDQIKLLEELNINLSKNH